MQSSPIVGFGIDDHQIRGLIRFIEMTSRESKNEDDIKGCRCPNYKRWLDLAQRRFKFFYVLKLSLGKAVLLRGILGQLVNC